MGLGPILPGRLPSSLVTARIVENLSTTQNALANLQQQISTGQRFFKPSDDPAATAAILLLHQSLQRQDQFQASLKIDQTFLQSTDASLQNLGQGVDQAKSLLLAGLGTTSTPAQNQALANQVDTITQGLLNDANAKVQGRYVFGGSQAQSPPFQLLGGGVVRYTGDQFQINSQVDSNFQAANNIDGVEAFGAISDPVGTDVNPAVTLQTRLSDLHSGRGIEPGVINVTISNGGPITHAVDLTSAQTVDDVKRLIESAFSPGAVTVGIVAGPPKNGITVTAASGTVTVSDSAGGTTAGDLGIAHAAAATITGADLDPRLTLQTALSALNGGIGASTSNGLFISNGSIQKSVDISSAVTVEDLFNTLRAANTDLDLNINAAGNGLAVANRLSGVNFSIGENGGGDAASLGLRTFNGATSLADLNFGQGVPVNHLDGQGNPMPALLEIDRRSGTTVNVDLQGASTIQDVLNKINAVDPGKLVASLNAVGNGISIVDNDGVSTGPLTIPASNLSRALGVNGAETGSDPTLAVVGKDVNPREANGIFNLLARLSQALRTSDNAELGRLQPLLDKEADHVTEVRGSLGSRQQLLQQVQSRLSDESVNLKQSLSDNLDVDMTQAITQLSQLTTSLSATLQVASKSMQMSLFNYL